MKLHNCKVAGVGINPESYHKTDIQRGHPDFPMSRGELMNFLSCPRRWMRGYQAPKNEGMEWGSLMDCLILTPDQFFDRFAITPETYQNDKGEQKPWNWNANVCKAWRDDHSGKEIVKHGDNAEARAALKRFKDEPQAWDYVGDSMTQVMVVGEYHARNGRLIPLKTLIDLVPHADTEFGKSLGDLKTAQSAAPGKWARVCFQHGYHVQAALSLDLYTGATGEDRVEFRHVIQESVPPWEVGLRILSQEMIELGRNTYISALELYAQCLATGKWLGYDELTAFHIGGWSLVQPEPWMAMASDVGPAAYASEASDVGPAVGTEMP